MQHLLLYARATEMTKEKNHKMIQMRQIPGAGFLEINYFFEDKTNKCKRRCACMRWYAQMLSVCVFVCGGECLFAFVCVCVCACECF